MSALISHKLDHEDRLRMLALAVARNKVGADAPVEDVLLAENVPEDEFERLLNDPVFTRQVKAFVTELESSGFSFAAKCRVLAEDVVHTLYHLAKDDEVPAAARVKAVENLVDWGGLAVRSEKPVGAVAGYQLVINFSSSSAAAPETYTGLTIEHPHTTVGVLAAADAAVDAPIDPDYA